MKNKKHGKRYTDDFRKMGCDITYIHTLRDGWCYLASVMDLHTKKIVGYSFSRTMTTELITNA